MAYRMSSLIFLFFLTGISFAFQPSQYKNFLIGLEGDNNGSPDWDTKHLLEDFIDLPKNLQYTIQAEIGDKPNDPARIFARNWSGFSTETFISQGENDQAWAKWLYGKIANHRNAVATDLHDRTVAFNVAWVITCWFEGRAFSCSSNNFVAGVVVAVGVRFQDIEPKSENSYKFATINLVQNDLKNDMILELCQDNAYCRKAWVAGTAGFPGHYNRDYMLDVLEEAGTLHWTWSFQVTGANQPPCVMNRNKCPFAYQPESQSLHNYMQFKASPTLKSDDSCESQLFNNLAGAGYNIVTGSPMADKDDGYLVAPVFAIGTSTDYMILESPERNDQGCPTWKYKYPRGYNMHVTYQLSSGESSNEMFSQASYQEASSNRVTASASASYLGAKASFTGSAEFKSFAEQTSSGNVVELRYYRESNAFESSVELFSLDFADNYLKALASGYAIQDFSAFFQMYGTHITTKVTHGARFSQISRFDALSFESMEANSQSLSMGIKASYMSASGSVDGLTENEKKAKDFFESFSSNQQKRSTGANGSPLDMSSPDGAKVYQELAHVYPAMLRSELFPHSRLIKARWDDVSKAIKDVDQDKFFQYWQASIDQFCGNQKYQCKAEAATNPPAPLTVEWDKPVDSYMYGGSECRDGTSGCDSHFTKFSSDDFHGYKDSLKIREIRIQCESYNGISGTRIAALQFVLYDWVNTLELPILGDKDTKQDWTQTAKLEARDFVANVKLRAGADIDMITFGISRHGQGSDLEYVGCGDNGGSQMDPINFIGRGIRLLDYSGYTRNADNGKFIRNVQFRSFPISYKSDAAVKSFHAKRQETSAAFFKSVMNDAQSHTSQPSQRQHVRKEQSHHDDLSRTVEHLEKTMNKIVASLQRLERDASCEADRHSQERILRDEHAKKDPGYAGPRLSERSGKRHTETFSHGRQNDPHSAPRDHRYESQSTSHSRERYYHDRPSHDGHW